MLTSYLRSYRWGFLVAAVVAVGCGGNEVHCPAVLESCPATPPTFGAPCAARGSAAICEYGVPFSAAVERDLVSAVQFHPEKSGDTGLKILSNWLSLSRHSSEGAKADAV